MKHGPSLVLGVTHRWVLISCSSGAHQRQTRFRFQEPAELPAPGWSWQRWPRTAHGRRCMRPRPPPREKPWLAKPARTLFAALRDRNTPVSGATKRHALATGAADPQRRWRRAHRCRSTPQQLAAVLIEHHDDDNPHTYVSCVGLAADGSVATDRSSLL